MDKNVVRSIIIHLIHNKILKLQIIFLGMYECTVYMFGSYKERFLDKLFLSAFIAKIGNKHHSS